MTDWTPVWISLKTTIAATAITCLAGILIARWRLLYRGRFGGVIDGIFVLPLALPPTVVGLILLTTLGRSSFLGALFSTHTILFTWYAAVLASVAVSFPLMYLTAKTAFQHIDASLLDVARIEGVGEWRILWSVMVPLAWHHLAAGATLSFVRALGEFGATLMVAGSIPGQTQTMPIAIFFFTESGEPRMAMALAVINVCISICALLLVGFLEKRRG